MKVVIDDCRIERMDVYTDPLNDKIKRQAAEITRLLAENENLKAENVNVIWYIEQAFDRGCNAAWKLAQKIIAIHGYSLEEIEGIFGTRNARECLLNYTYTEAAAKVAEWKQKKEEICVGDVVMLYEKLGLVTFVGKHVTVITEKGTTFVATRGDCTKTGRHIDVDAWLAQIGDER